MSVLEDLVVGIGADGEQAGGEQADTDPVRGLCRPVASLSWPRLLTVPEALPPPVQWRVPEAVGTNQEPLDFGVAQLQPQSDRDAVSSLCTVPRWSQQATGLPDAALISVSLARALIETLHGHRPVQQLTRWATDTVLATISWQVRSNGTAGRKAHARRSNEARPGSNTLKSVRVQFPRPEVAEVSVHLVQHGRSLAMAFRLEGRSDRWICTALELG